MKRRNGALQNLARISHPDGASRRIVLDDSNPDGNSRLTTITNWSWLIPALMLPARNRPRWLAVAAIPVVFVFIVMGRHVFESAGNIVELKRWTERRSPCGTALEQWLREHCSRAVARKPHTPSGFVSGALSESFRPPLQLDTPVFNVAAVRFGILPEAPAHANSLPRSGTAARS